MRCVAIVLLGAGCVGEPPNELEGSIDDEYPLAFDEVRAVRQDTVLRLEYQRAEAGVTEVVRKLIVETSGRDMQAADLAGSPEEMGMAVTRVSTDRRQFPEWDGGAFTVKRWGFEAGEEVEGEFNVLF